MARKRNPKDPYEKKPIYFDRKLQKSKAYWSLTGLAPQYLTELMGRRQMHFVNADRVWVVKNNGEIVFTYTQAKKKYGVNSGRHSRALKKLLEVGFIDISHLGGGMNGDCTKFSISKRWKEYGTLDFKKKEWPKDTRREGNPNIRDFGKGRNNG